VKIKMVIILKHCRNKLQLQFVTKMLIKLKINRFNRSMVFGKPVVEITF